MKSGIEASLERDDTIRMKVIIVFAVAFLFLITVSVLVYLFSKSFLGFIVWICLINFLLFKYVG